MVLAERTKNHPLCKVGDFRQPWRSVALTTNDEIARNPPAQSTRRFEQRGALVAFPDDQPTVSRHQYQWHQCDQLEGG